MDGRGASRCAARVQTLEELLRAQDGVVTREQALAVLSPAALRHRLRPGGPWQRVLPAVYVAQTGPLTGRQRLRAALLHGGPLAQLGGPTALALHGLAPHAPVLHLLVPHSTQPVARTGLAVHRTHRLPVPVRVEQLPVSPVSRAVVDAGRLLAQLDDVRALVAGAVQRRRTTVERLQDELEAGHSGGSALVRAALLEVADGVRSAPEAQLRGLLLSSRVLPPARWNCRLLLHGRWLADPDAYLEPAGLVVECDSRRWHLTPADWEATLARHDRMEAAGLRVLHVTPQRLHRDPRGVLRTVEDAYRAGLRSGPPPGVRVLLERAVSSA